MENENLTDNYCNPIQSYNEFISNRIYILPLNNLHFEWQTTVNQNVLALELNRKETLMMKYAIKTETGLDMKQIYLEFDIPVEFHEKFDIDCELTDEDEQNITSFIENEEGWFFTFSEEDFEMFRQKFLKKIKIAQWFNLNKQQLYAEYKIIFNGDDFICVIDKIKFKTTNKVVIEFN